MTTDLTILITGGTAGIGSRSALGVAGPGTRLLITGRDAAKGEQAARRMADATSGRIEFIPADLTSFVGVRQLAADVAERTDRLDVLVNNVGALVGERRMTTDGVEMTWAVNHLAPYLLTRELRPLLARAERSRVIGLATTGHRFARIRLDNLQGEHVYVPMSNYGAAKLAHLMVMTEWSSELDADGITVLFADPGGAATDMTASMRSSYLPRWMRPLAPMMTRMTSGRDPEASQTKAARSTIHAATEPSLEGRQGAYILPDTKIGQPSRRSRDSDMRRRLHDLTRSQLAITKETSR